MVMLTINKSTHGYHSHISNIVGISPDSDSKMHTQLVKRKSSKCAEVHGKHISPFNVVITLMDLIDRLRWEQKVERTLEDHKVEIIIV